MGTEQRQSCPFGPWSLWRRLTVCNQPSCYNLTGDKVRNRILHSMVPKNVIWVRQPSGVASAKKVTLAQPSWVYWVGQKLEKGIQWKCSIGSLSQALGVAWNLRSGSVVGWLGPQLCCCLACQHPLSKRLDLVLAVLPILASWWRPP